MPIRVTMSGKFDPAKLMKKLSSLGEADNMPKHLAETFMKMLTENIENNTYDFTLSEYWTRIKKQKGWDERPFIAQGHYLNLLEVGLDDHHLAIGFPESARHPRSGMSMAELAVLLEYGRLEKNLPARPLWRNTFRDFFATVPKEIKVELKRLMHDARRI